MKEFCFSFVVSSLPFLKVLKVKNRIPVCLLSHAWSSVRYSHVHEAMPLFASLLVTLLHPHDQHSVAEGTVCHAGETVHGRTLREDEVAITVTALLVNYAVVHPSYEYPVELGGFTAWWRVHCKLQEKQKLTD